MTFSRRSSGDALSVIGCVAMALLSWRTGSRLWHIGLTALHTPALLMMIAAHVVGFALLACVVLRRSERLKGALAVVVVALCFSGHLYADATFKSEAETFLSTDVHAYMDYAARVTLAGKNPYETSMLAVWNDYRVSILESTGLVDGDIPDRVAYPALSFLVLVPFIALHLPTQYLCFVVFGCALLVIAAAAPRRARMLAIIPFLFEDNYLAYMTAGVIDVAWCFFLAVAALTWRRLVLSAVFIGLACAHKQHAWLVVPFLLAVRWNEDPRPWRKRLAHLAAWAGIAAGVFLLFNGYFIWRSPTAWRNGVLDPLQTPMITWGSGLSSTTLSGLNDVSPRTYLVLFAMAYVVALFAIVRHARLAPLAWMAPGFAFFFNNRSLSSYWYFYAIPFVVAALRPRSRASTTEARSAWPALAMAGGFVVVGAGLWLRDASRRPAVVVKLLEPHVADGFAVYRVRLHVENRSLRELEPRVAVYSNGIRPFVWPAREGKEKLGPGESGEYEVQSPYPGTGIDIARGAKIFVYDRAAPSERGLAHLEPELGIRRPDAIPNDDYRLWPPTLDLPSFWGLLVRGTQLPRLTLAAEQSLAVHVPADVRPELLFPQRQCGDDVWRWNDGPRRFVALEQRTMLPAQPIDVTAWRPARATAPTLSGMLYGVRILTDHRQSAVLLFGEVTRDGRLEDGTPYRMLQAPADVASRHRVDLAGLLATLGVQVIPTRQVVPRGPHLDLVASVVRLQLFVAGAEELGDFRLGRIHGSPPAYPVPRVEEHGWDEMWRAQRNSELRNHDKALDELAGSPAPARVVGDIATRAGRPEEAARAYRDALERGDDRALVGTEQAWALYTQREYPKAREEFIRVLQIFEARGLMCDDEAYARALKGLASTLAQLGDCVGSRDARAQMKRQAPALRVDRDVLLACPDVDPR